MLLIIDGNSILNRAFYGIKLLSTKEGLYTNGVYGFLNILFKTLEQTRADGVCVCFDLKAPTFRHKMYDGYKAQRRPMPDELAVQFPILKQVLASMNIKTLELEGYEADDIIGTLSVENPGESQILTGDRDSFSLISDKTTLLLVTSRMGQTDTTRYTATELFEKYGLAPNQILDLKALMGDTSDNIPGVTGVGEKTANDLIARFGSIENIYENLDGLDIKDSLRTKLSNGKEDAFLSKKLATICTTVPIEADFDQMKNKPYQPELYDLLYKLEFKSLIKKLGLQPSGLVQVEKVGFELPLNTIKITTPQQAQEFLNVCRNKISFVAGFDSLSSLCVICENTAYLAGQDTQDYKNLLKQYFADDCKKVCHNAAGLYVPLMKKGIDPDGVIFCTALAAYLINPTEKGYGIEEMAENYLGQTVQMPPEQVQLSLDQPADDPKEQIQIAAACAGLYKALPPILKDFELENLYYKLELPLAKALAEMQIAGVKIDREKLAEFGIWLQNEIEQATGLIYMFSGEEFNINSPKQLGTILFETLGLPGSKKTKSGYSTDVEVLERLKNQHPIIEPLLKYRQLSKLKSTYVDGLSKVIASDGRIHSTFNQTVTATGRISSAEPNMQNIPVRKQLGSEFRKMFVAKSPEHVLIDADYSQIELCILAHVSKDPTMSRAFTENIDIHTLTAMQVFGLESQEQVTPQQRSNAKAVNFGIVYGISDFALSQDLGITRAQAKEYIENYLTKYELVGKYLKDVVEQAKQTGYVTTIMGRRRPVPELKSTNHNIRSFGERVAMNMPIQGAAADIMKQAMLNLRDRLKAEEPEAQIVLQVHDELLVESPKDRAERIAEIVKQEMEQAVLLDVPLRVEVGVGDNWYNAKA